MISRELSVKHFHRNGFRMKSHLEVFRIQELYAYLRVEFMAHKE